MKCLKLLNVSSFWKSYMGKIKCNYLYSVEFVTTARPGDPTRGPPLPLHLTQDFLQKFPPPPPPPPQSESQNISESEQNVITFGQ